MLSYYKMGSSTKPTAALFIFMICMLNALPPISACGTCNQPPSGHHHHHHHHHKGSPSHGHHKPHPPVIINPPAPVIVTPNPPVIVTPNPPVIVTPNPPVIINPPPYTGPPSGGGGVSPITPAPQTCPIDALKLGLCVDVLGGLVHIGLGDPVENTCCPVLGGLLELEAAVCLCVAIRIKLLNLNIFIPLALQALITCGKTPPPGFVCPPL